ncbi:hypothetical protein [Amycolatopsis orientalis]|uniref:hypothetical protein n=1 Tax=Amycolatopsis orientalis TaxID=31958 RepID=UPI000402B02A|nr:hypothetical protein [Amycolatopsis orientalis]
MTTIKAGGATADLDAVEAFRHRWEQAWNGHDGDAVAAMCADDLVYDEPAPARAAASNSTVTTGWNWVRTG